MPVKEFDTAWRFIHQQSGVRCALNLSSRPDQPPFHWFFYLLTTGGEEWWMPIRKACPTEVAQVGRAITEQEGHDTPTVSIPSLTFFREEFTGAACIGVGMAGGAFSLPDVLSPTPAPGGGFIAQRSNIYDKAEAKEKDRVVTRLSEVREKRAMEEELRALRREDAVYLKGCDSPDFAELLEEAFFSLELKIFLETLIRSDADQSPEGCRRFAHSAIINIKKAISENPSLAKNPGKQYTLVSTYLLR